MQESKTYRDLFFSLFDAAKQAETELCQPEEDAAAQARRMLSEAIDRCYDELRRLEG